MQQRTTLPLDRGVLGAAAVAALLALTAPAAAEDNTRGVRILEGPDLQSLPALIPPPSPLVPPRVIGAPIPELPPLVAPPPPAPPVAAAPPVALPPAAPEPPAPAPALSNPVAAVSPVAVPPSAPSSTYNVTATPEASGTTTTVPLADLRRLQREIKVANAAALTLDILPGPMLAIGSRVAFRISTKRAGYLILVDVDPSGKLTQIYPNPISTMSAAGRQGSNYLRPGKPLQIPNSTEAFSGFEFVASPPVGTAIVVAILSDRPVQLVDLPDVPPAMAGQAAALAFLTKLANDLRVPAGEAGSALHEVKWSFDAKFYAIR
jgi:hypothetical protein